MLRTFILLSGALLSFSAAAERVYLDNSLKISEIVTDASYYAEIVESSDARRSVRIYTLDGHVAVEKACQNADWLVEGCVPDGEVIKYYGSENPASLENYRDGALHGDSLLYYENGRLRERVSYHEGVRHGIDEVFYPDGQVSRRAEYVKGELHGEVVQYTEDGEIERLENYIDGEPYGIYEIYGWNGLIIESGENFGYDENYRIISQGEFFEYYDNGEISRIERRNVDGQLVYGIYYDYDGHVVSRVEIIDTPHGSGVREEAWHDGKVSMVTETNDEGTWRLRRSYDNEERLLSYSEELNGLLQGEQRVVRSDGTIDVTQFQDGLENGEYRHVTVEGDVLGIGQYEKGNKVGRWEIIENGHSVIKNYNDHGELHGRVRSYYNGQLALLANYRAGERHGDYVEYMVYSSGEFKLLGAERYSDGRLVGNWVSPWAYIGIAWRATIHKIKTWIGGW